MLSDHLKNLLRAAFDAYLLERNKSGHEPCENYLTYDFESINSNRWTLQGLGNLLVVSELREITNRLNHWHTSLHQWQAWNTVIQAYGENDAWDLRSEFLDSVAHQCLLTPFSIRDTFTFVATNSMHQVRMSACTNYPDHLEGDPKKPSDKPKNLSRSQKEKRLADIISIWSEGHVFMTLLKQIDDQDYRKSTSDYRNQNSHSIGPRLAIGQTQHVVRCVQQATEMSRQEDGTYIHKPLPDKMCVSYGFGATEPLDMESARAANLEQYRLARTCYTKYRELLACGMASMSMPIIEPENDH